MKRILILLLIAVITVPAIAGKTKQLKSKYVRIKTSYGTCVIRLYNETPKHRDNFIKLAQEGFYDSLLFHRVIQNFMIQGGDPDSKNAKPGQALGNGGPDYKVPAEFNPALFHKKGALAAARDNNPEKASSSCQFYIVHGKKFTDEELAKFELKRTVPYTAEQKAVYNTIGGTPHLDGNYTVFGEVVDGMEMVDKIAAVQKDAKDRPLEDVRMQVDVLKKYKVKKKKKA